jgi:hypothetical protein
MPENGCPEAHALLCLQVIIETNKTTARIFPEVRGPALAGLCVGAVIWEGVPLCLSPVSCWQQLGASYVDLGGANPNPNPTLTWEGLTLTLTLTLR